VKHIKNFCPIACFFEMPVIFSAARLNEVMFFSLSMVKTPSTTLSKIISRESTGWLFRDGIATSWIARKRDGIMGQKETLS